MRPRMIRSYMERTNVHARFEEMGELDALYAGTAMGRDTKFLCDGTS